MKYAFLISPVVAWAMAASGPSYAEPAAASPAYAQQLDDMLAAGDVSGVTKTLRRPGQSPEEFQAGTNWAYGKIMSGAASSYNLSLIYSRNLWDISHHESDPATAQNAKLAAGLSALYAFELLQIDGARCADRSAPGSHVEGFMSITAEQLDYLAAQPRQAQSAKIDQAIEMERKTAGMRPADPYLCHGGMSEYRNAMEKGSQSQVPDAAGTGVVTEVKPSADWKPEMLAPEQFKPVQEEDRAGMRGVLGKMLEGRAQPAK